MLSLPANLIAEKNKLHSTAPWIILLDITLTDDTVLRFCNNNENVTFSGNLYTFFPFTIGPVEYSAEGQIPVVPLKVCNVTRVLQPYLNALDGAVGSTVVMTLVNTDHLAEDYSELELTFTVTGCETDAMWVTWTLGMANPYNKRFPLYRYLADHCSWVFKGAECGYSGAETICNRTLERCSELNNTAYFGGYKGMKGGGLQIA